MNIKEILYIILNRLDIILVIIYIKENKTFVFILKSENTFNLKR